MRAAVDDVVLQAASTRRLTESGTSTRIIIATHPDRGAEPENRLHVSSCTLVGVQHHVQTRWTVHKA